MPPASDTGPLRVVHAVAPGAVGGIESVVRLLALGQREAGHAVTVATVVDAEGHPFVEQLRARDVDVRPIVAPDRAYRAEIAAFREILGATTPDVVHTHGTRPDVLLARAARRSGLRTVTTVHGFSGGDWKNRLYEVLQRRAMRAMSAVAAVSAAQRPILESAGVPRDRIHVVPNAWAPVGDPLDRSAARAALGLEGPGPTIGYVGRLSHEKGPDLLVEALGRLTDLDWTASFVGDGAEAPGLRARANELGLGDRIRWHGAVPDAWRCFRAFDVLAMPSRTEGTPISLFEAMDAGVPLVVTRVGGVPAVLAPGADGAPLGHLVPPLDPEALAEGLRRALTSSAGLSAETERARARLTEVYAVGPWLARYEALYRSRAVPAD